MIQQKIMNWLRLLKKHDRFVTIKWYKQNLIFVTINWYKQNLIILLLLWLNTIWIDKKNWRIKITKKQKNILYDKCQVDFLNNQYLNNREQKRMLYNNCKNRTFWVRFRSIANLMHLSKSFNENFRLTRLLNRESNYNYWFVYKQICFET